jgi:hypothetical protein
MVMKIWIVVSCVVMLRSLVFGYHIFGGLYSLQLKDIRTWFLRNNDNHLYKTVWCLNPEDHNRQEWFSCIRLRKGTNSATSPRPISVLNL